MSSTPFENGSYYFWKWADNDLRGQPSEVQAALLRGAMHPAIQTFDAGSLLRLLEKWKSHGRVIGEEWEWQVASTPEKATFVFVSCPAFDRSEASAIRFIHGLSPLGLSGFDEQKGIVIQGLNPKNNCFILGQFPYNRAYDIGVGDLPGLLKRIQPGRCDSFGVLEDRKTRSVKCVARARRFIVEWQDKHDLGDANEFHHWNAQDRKRLEALEAPYALNGVQPSQDPDLITYTGALKICRAFLRGEPRPHEYLWRNFDGGSRGRSS